MTSNDPNVPLTTGETQALMPWEVPLPNLDWPPGVVGEVAQFIYHSAPRPVREVAVVGALGLFAGICGKGWQVSGTGLNAYLILIGRSGIGKEAMHSALSILLRDICMRVPGAFKFVNFNAMASGPALVKVCESQPCFVNVVGEFGKVFASIEKSQPDSAHATLRRAMLNLYSKSGSKDIAGGITYSNKDNNVESVLSVAYSMIGETTPGTFYDAITETAMEDGFMSRFTVVEYEGDRPDENRARRTSYPELTDWLAALAQHSIKLAMDFAHVQVQLDTDAQAMFDTFSKHCDSQIRGQENEGWRQMWNRAHLKAIRIAGLLSIGSNPSFPVITTVYAEWAIQLILRDIRVFTRKLQSGEVGDGDDAMHTILASLIREFFTQPLPTWCNERGFDKLMKAYLLPWNWLVKRTSKIKAFKKHKLGSNKALEIALDEFIKAGLLAEASPSKVWDQHEVQCKCYRVLRIEHSDGTEMDWMERWALRSKSM